MHLLLRRSQRDASWFSGLFGESMLFMLDARLELEPEEQELFQRYQLNDVAIYDSDARAQHAHSAHQSYDEYDAAVDRISAETGQEAWQAFLDSLQHLGAGIWSTVLARLSLQITLGSLVEGQHLETESLEEVLAVENVIKEGVAYLARYLQLSVTFDGREDLDEY